MLSDGFRAEGGQRAALCQEQVVIDFRGFKSISTDPTHEIDCAGETSPGGGGVVSMDCKSFYLLKMIKGRSSTLAGTHHE